MMITTSDNIRLTAMNTAILSAPNKILFARSCDFPAVSIVRVLLVIVMARIVINHNNIE